jgi:hypothetical protein
MLTGMGRRNTGSLATPAASSVQNGQDGEAWLKFAQASSETKTIMEALV